MYPLNTGPIRFPFAPRKVGLWVSPLVYDTATYVIDTARLGLDDEKYAGPDDFPNDCLLVVISPSMHQKLIEESGRLPYPVSGPALALLFIEKKCAEDREFAKQIGWK